MTIIGADENESEPIRLHEIYKIGEWDPLKETFGAIETAAEVKARYERELDEVRATYEERDRKRDLEMKELRGLVRGYMAGQEKPAETPAAEAVPA
jgi:hypothetical protein